MNATGLDHLYISVSDFDRSESFYDGVMKALGFRKGDKRIADAPHAHYFNQNMQYTIRPATAAAPHDPEAPGLHHVCFQVASRKEVDRVHAALSDLGVEATAPAEHPEYHDDYYATFFADPDGIRLEIVARSRYRDEIVELWPNMKTFLNPVADLKRKP